MRSKNLNIMTTYEMAQRFKQDSITVNAYHPGFVRSGLASNLGAGKRLAVWLATPFLIQPAQGADTGVWLATSNEVASASGLLFSKRKPVQTASFTYDRVLSERIWERSMAMLRQRQTEHDTLSIQSLAQSLR